MTRTITTTELLTYRDEPLGTSPWVPMTQAQVDGFAEATGDHQWVHVDPVRARLGPFGATIAHGYLLLSIVPILLKDLLRVQDSTRGVNYGIDRVRFTAPVPVGNEIALTAAIGEATRRTDGGILYSVDFTLQVRTDSGPIPAMVGRTLYVVYPEAVH